MHSTTHRSSTRNFAVDTLVRTLRSYGVLTEPRLAELSGGRYWPGDYMFKDTLRQAIAEGRIAELGSRLYQLGVDEEVPAPPLVPAGASGREGDLADRSSRQGASDPTASSDAAAAALFTDPTAGQSAVHGLLLATDPTRSR